MTNIGVSVPEEGAVWDDLTPDGKLGCRSCPAKFKMPARYMATPKRIDGAASATDWPLCEAHMQYAMLAGWFPIEKIATVQGHSS